MAKRAGLGWLFWLALAGFVACSFDDRTLQVTPGSGGTASSGATSGGDAGKVVVGESGADSSSEGGGSGLAAGQQCGADNDCATGPCLDGVCCAAACDGPCLSCSNAVTGKADGECQGALSGTDPHDDCAAGQDVCALDGECDGAGACRFAPPSTNCGAEACAADQYTPPSQCDGAGECVTPMAVSCSGHPCVGTRCDIPCTTTSDCPQGLFCDNDVCAPQQPNGTDCTISDECSSGICTAENVCCDKACDTPCSSCLQTSTGQTDGKCAFVQAGAQHASDCPGAAKCNGGATGVTPAPTCNGAGMCMTGADAPCGNYKCNAVNASCEVQCSTAAQCASGAYCAGGTCKAKLAGGTVCTSDGQCASGDCPGRCCASGTPCDCPQPSAGNVIQNPGFDSNLAGWNIDNGTSTINWQPGTFMTGNMVYADGHACPFSGAAYVSNPNSSENSQNIWQCVSITPQTEYDFGVQQATLSGAFTHCLVDLYQGPGCTGGNPYNVADVQWINVDWSSAMYPTVFDSSYFVSARVYCYVEPGGSFFFDGVYLTPAPGLY